MALVREGADTSAMPRHRARRGMGSPRVLRTRPRQTVASAVFAGSRSETLSLVLPSLRAGALAPVPISVAALVRDGHVLLVHRHPSRRWYPDCWDLVGGHVESGGLPHQAASRECLEELGVRVHDPL